MMQRRGYTIFVYLDDMLVVSKDLSGCWSAFNELVNLITNLGLTVNWDKVSPPTQNIDFLGVHINTVDRRLSLPLVKLEELYTLICSWSNKKRASKKNLQRLVGKLSWAARVIRGGRTFLRRLINLSNKLKGDRHRTWITREARLDIAWWQSCILAFNGSAPFITDIPPPVTSLHMDACLSGGGSHVFR